MPSDNGECTHDITTRERFARRSRPSPLAGHDAAHPLVVSGAGLQGDGLAGRRDAALVDEVVRPVGQKERVEDVVGTRGAVVVEHGDLVADFQIHDALEDAGVVADKVGVRVVGDAPGAHPGAGVAVGRGDVGWLALAIGHFLAEEADEAACGIGRSVVVGRRCGLGPARRLQGLLGEHILAGLIKVVGPHPQGVAHALAHAPREAEGRHLVGIAFGRGGSQHDGQPQAHRENQGKGPGCLSRCEEGAKAHEALPFHDAFSVQPRCAPPTGNKERAEAFALTLSTSRQDFHPSSLNILLIESLGKT